MFENGVEEPRVNVVLATAIPKERCDKINLGYMNPAQIKIADYENREDDGVPGRPPPRRDPPPA